MKIKIILLSFFALSAASGIFLSKHDKKSEAPAVSEAAPPALSETSKVVQEPNEPTLVLKNETQITAVSVKSNPGVSQAAPSAPRSAQPLWNFDRALFQPSDIQPWIGTPEKPNPRIAQVKFYDGKEGQVFTQGAKETAKSDGKSPEKLTEKSSELPITLNLMNQAGLAKVQEDRIQLSAAYVNSFSSTSANAQTISTDSKIAVKDSVTDASSKVSKDPSVKTTDSNSDSPLNTPASVTTTPTPAQPKALGAHDFEIVAFHPGFTHDHQGHVQILNDMNAAILGPDFSFKSVAKEKLAAEGGGIKARVISFGHGGELILRVKNGGWVQDESGADFTIYENVFKIRKDVFHQEFARVGVAEEDRDDAYHWFPCNPASNQFVGCAGVIPTSRGGDIFDLSWIGVSRIKYIKIVDLGNNAHFNKTSEGIGLDSTEGFDFDSMILHHAFITP